MKSMIIKTSGEGIAENITIESYQETSELTQKELSKEEKRVLNVIFHLEEGASLKALYHFTGYRKAVLMPALCGLIERGLISRTIYCGTTSQTHKYEITEAGIFTVV